MDLKDWMELVDYRITEGSDYGWPAFGDKVYSLSYWNEDHDGHSMNIVFDRGTQEVYIVEACDYKHQRAYRFINPLYKDKYAKTVKDLDDPDWAWDDTPWTDLEVYEDWLDKAQAIIDGEDYDTRVSVPLEFSDEDLLTYMKLAHERDMTFNEFIEEALRSAIEEYKRDPEGLKARWTKFSEEKTAD